MFSKGSVHISFPRPESATAFIGQSQRFFTRGIWWNTYRLPRTRTMESPSSAKQSALEKKPTEGSRLHTIVNTIVASSHPNWPPRQRNLAAIRRMKATTDSTPPTMPAIDTVFVRSRIGASHAVLVTFFVAELLVVGSGYYGEKLVNSLRDCLIVQLINTHASTFVFNSVFVHIQVWLVKPQVDCSIPATRHFSYEEVSLIDSTAIDSAIIPHTEAEQWPVPEYCWPLPWQRKALRPVLRSRSISY